MTISNDLQSLEHKSSQTKIETGLRGIDHLALVTDDMAATVDFYTKVLGLSLVHVRRVPFAADRGQPPYDNLRHYFFDMGNDSLLAFFEYPKEAPTGNRDSISSMQHLAFHANRKTFEDMMQVLESRGVEYAGPIYLGDRFTSIYFYDPNGIRLEITTDIDKDEYETVTSVYQSEEVAKVELATLYEGRKLEEVLVSMPKPLKPSSSGMKPNSEYKEPSSRSASPVLDD